MGFGGALYRRDKDGGPWVPPWWFSFVLLRRRHWEKKQES